MEKHEYPNSQTEAERWYSTSELAAILNLSDRAIRKRYTDLPRRKRQGRGGEWEYAFHDLPQDVQAVLLHFHYRCNDEYLTTTVTVKESAHAAEPLSEILTCQFSS